MVKMKSVFKILFFVLLLSFLLDKLVYLGLNKVSDRVFSGQNIGKLNHFFDTQRHPRACGVW